MNARLDKATFAAGCFWGVESLFRQVEGVTDVAVGYTGGQTKDPTYQDVCGGWRGAICRTNGSAQRSPRR